jgi:hypothetical protein
MAELIQKTKEAEAKVAYGRTLDEPITYAYKWTEYPDPATLAEHKDELTLEEQVKVRNVERQGKARQAALTAALDAAGIKKPTIETDEQLRLREMFKVLMSTKLYTEEKARELASQNLGGVAWAE